MKCGTGERTPLKLASLSFTTDPGPLRKGGVEGTSYMGPALGSPKTE